MKKNHSIWILRAVVNWMRINNEGNQAEYNHEGYTDEAIRTMKKLNYDEEIT